MHDKPCPKCGHCPTCGRSNQTYPWGTYPYWPPRPYYGQPLIYGRSPFNGVTSTPAKYTNQNASSPFQLSNAI